MIDKIVYFLIVLAIAAVAYWAITKLPLPEPVRIIVQVVIAIFAIYFLWSLV